MKIKRILSFVLAAALFFPACTNELEEASSCAITEVQAVFPAGTKTTLDSETGAVSWLPAEEINVFFNGVSAKFTSTNTETANVATFTGNLPIAIGSTNELQVPAYTWGLYPYNATATSDGASITSTLADQQIAAENTVANGVLMSVARSDSYSLAFYNVCGGVRFKLSTEGVTSVTLKSNGEEALAGKVKIGFDQENHPEILEVIEPKSEITLTCEEGFQTGVWYYIATLPGTLVNGVTFTMYTESKEASKMIDNSLTIKRSIFGSIASLDEGVVWKESGNDDDNTKPASNQIFYTSSDEQTLAPFNNDIYDPNGNKLTLVSNVYTNGTGIMTFSGDVDRIGTQAFYNRPRLVTLTLPEGLRTIGASAITDNIRLESLFLPESLTTIGEYCFENNAKLSSIPTLGSIKKLASYFVYGCSSLASIVIPEGVTSIGDWAFHGCSSLTSIVIPEGVTSIGDSAFSCCSSLTSIVIPEGVTSIGDSAFYGCSSLTSIVIPEGVTSIGGWAFDGCSSLTSIVIPEGVTSIGNSAFYCCSSLTSIVIPEGVTSIGRSAFEGCSSLTSIVIPEGVTSIGVYAFWDCSGLTSIVIPEGVTSIAEGAFSGCSSLTSIVIPEGVTSIAEGAFYGCSSLTSIVIPEGVTSIAEGAFYGCSSLTSIVIPEGVTSIGDSAFYGCSSLTSIVIPEGVTSIGGWAFTGCSSLSEVNCKPIVPPTIGYYPFSGCSSLSRINVPMNSVDSYKSATNWSNYASKIQGYIWE